jgi:elongation factor Ts
VGVLVEFEGSDVAVARATAMQIAAMTPLYVSRDEVPAEDVDNERRVVEATAREEGKPEAALPKIIEGRVTGFYKTVALLDQDSVQEKGKSVGKVLEEAGVTVKRFARFEVGQS